MSGGSYNYLCFYTDDLHSRGPELDAMHQRLESSGYREAARATREVIRSLEITRRMAEALADVWQAVEWADSSDWSEDQVREVIARFSPWPPPA